MKTHIAAIAVAFAVTACTESKPAAAPKKKAADVTSPAPGGADSGLPESTLGQSGTADATSGTNVDLTPDCDPNKDFYQLDFPDKIKDCLKQEKLYNFDFDECTPMNKATFDCNFDSVKKELADLEVGSGELDRQKAKGAKLIGCGASNNGFTIVTMFWFKAANPDKKDCTYSHQGKVTGSCFRKYATEAVPPAPTGEKEMRDFVRECMATE